MRILLPIVLLAGCHAEPPVRPTVAALTPAPPPPEWPITTRVWVRGAAAAGGGLVLFEEWSASQPPTSIPQGDDWFVEPNADLSPNDYHAFIDELAAHHVPGVALRNRAVDSDLLAALRQVTSVIALELSDSQISDLAAQQFPRLHAADSYELRRLFLNGATISKPAMSNLLQACTSLDIFYADDTLVDDRMVDSIADSVGVLSLANTEIDDNVDLSRFSKLQIVDLDETPIGAHVVSQLSIIPLRQLSLASTRVGDFVATLAPLAISLQKLDLSNDVTSDRNLAWIGNAVHLVSLELGGVSGDSPIATQRTDALKKTGLALGKLTTLEKLNVGGTAITAKALQSIIDHDRQLRFAYFPDVHAMTDALAAQVLALPLLESVNLNDDALSNSALEHLDHAPQIRELYLSGSSIDDNGTHGLGQLKDLRAISLGASGVSDATAAIIVALAELETVDLSSTRLTSKAIASLSTIPKLQRLYVNDDDVNDDALHAIGDLVHLRILYANRAAISTDVAARALSELTALEEVSLERTQLDDSFAHTVASWPRLKTLSLADTTVGNAVVAALANAQELRTLKLGGTMVRSIAPLLGLPKLAEFSFPYTSGMNRDATDEEQVNDPTGPKHLVELLLTFPSLRVVEIQGTDDRDWAGACDLARPLQKRGIRVIAERFASCHEPQKFHAKDPIPNRDEAKALRRD